MIVVLCLCLSPGSAQALPKSNISVPALTLYIYARFGHATAETGTPPAHFGHLTAESGHATAQFGHCTAQTGHVAVSPATPLL